MKKMITLTAIILFVVSGSITAQKGQASTGHSYGDNYTDSDYHHKNRGEKEYRGHTGRRNMSKKELKRLKQLREKLDKLNRRSRRDGYVNRRERKEIWKLESEIHQLLRRNRYHGQADYRSGQGRNCR